jgi:hypothetical protein
MKRDQKGNLLIIAALVKEALQMPGRLAKQTTRRTVEGKRNRIMRNSQKQL